MTYKNGTVRRCTYENKKKSEKEKRIQQSDRDGDRPERHRAGSLPKRETLCLTKAANLQKILREEEKKEEGER